MLWHCILVSDRAEFSQLILAPVSGKLGKKHLVIVADGALEEIPFTALSEPNQPLLVNHEIVNLPSVTAIATHREDLNKRLCYHPFS
ncbi:CHAT domain-containing protein [Nostoc commune]|uniref:CHAT domain-containing protein n=1 Tax=Nostoc commune TaxID=1178 RepID=UPI0018C67400|nr:CHAT domain-containing protein [Nostoc commune BAE]MBG1262419.1 CHAT domain-containing protein [Nostoc commune BAE]